MIFELVGEVAHKRIPLQCAFLNVSAGVAFPCMSYVLNKRRMRKRKSLFLSF